ncbi:TAXI family TRAP transporter solute-binding subunit [Bradyrhizobium frederickii]|uniref:TAXI family TRAP transporter solute-binding subunit n=1 Tax=Bradyrhizobium frederickii TaxID=2560054 RepID=A0A4Y9L0B9_9BRAD|nr:TAXI family TRAP transporter solute-binding subunit [Bradyrhizobium frederickii]TFV36256.1 TAXI family TRAP transporter solute-binding subunit [Bradyrhizobium frederickii]
MVSGTWRILMLLAFVLLPSRLAATAEAHWPQVLSLGTASEGGTYYVYGEGLARLLTRELGIPVVARPTGGPIDNIKLLESGEIQLAFVTQGVALQAWNASAAWTGGRPHRNMRVMFAMYDTPFQFQVLGDSPVQSLADFAGKRIGVGPEGGTTAAYFPEFLKALKIEATLVSGDWAVLAEKSVARSIDALAVGAGVPAPFLIDIERKAKVRYIPLTRQEIATLRLAMPELSASVVAAGTYPTLRRRYDTVGLFNFAVARKDLPDDLVTAIVDTVFANNERLIESHPAAAETIPSNITRNNFIPLHGGAVSWYRSRVTPGVAHSD